MSGVAVSIRPSEFVQAGLPNDVDVEITGSRTMMFKYPNSDTDPSLSVELTMKNLETGDESVQNLSCGGGFVPTDDGKGFSPTGARTALSKGTNFFLFLESMVAAGFPEDKLGNDVSLLVGTQCHIVRRRPEKARNIEGAEGRDVMMVQPPLLKLPWENKGKATKSAAKSAGGATKSAAAGGGTTGDPQSRAVEVLKELAAGDGVEFAGIRPAAFKLLKAEPGIRAAVLELLTNEEWIKANVDEAGLLYDEGKIIG